MDFHSKIAIAEDVASFKPRSPAFERTNSDRTLSASFILVIARAGHLIALLISPVTMFKFLSSKSSHTSIVAGAAARILPIKIPLVKVVKR